MRSTIIVSAFAALALAAPRPQDIEFDQADAVPDTTPVIVPTDVTAETVDVPADAVIVAAAQAAVTDVASPEKRDFLGGADSLSRRGAICAVQPGGKGPVVR
jgi:ABC-type Fe3+-hydroxamate transport system substrate-binding protein